MGIYLALTIPVAVFPSTDFPRIVVGADAGVVPIDQMMVTVTQPLEEAVNTVPGLDHLSSVTSRGTAEIDLFFNWNVDMFQTLDLVNAALARIQPTLPANTKLTANRLTFAAFPIMGYSLTSEKIPQTTLWELANYTLKPRLNRATGVSSIVVQGGQVPEFLVQPDAAKLIEAGVTIPNILDAVSRSNMIDSPGLIEANHQLESDVDERPGARRRRHRKHHYQNNSSGRALAYFRCCHGKKFGDARLYGSDGERETSGLAECLSAAGQQHGGSGQRRSRRNREPAKGSSAGCRRSSLLRPIGAGERLDQ